MQSTYGLDSLSTDAKQCSLNAVLVFIFVLFPTIILILVFVFVLILLFIFVVILVYLFVCFFVFVILGLLVILLVVVCVECEIDRRAQHGIYQA